MFDFFVIYEVILKVVQVMEKGFVFNVVVGCGIYYDIYSVYFVEFVVEGFCCDVFLMGFGEEFQVVIFDFYLFDEVNCIGNEQ